MGFRKPIGLADIDNGDHFRSLLTGGGPIQRRHDPDDPFTAVGPAQPDQDPGMPWKYGYGVTACSSTTTLDLLPRICWDVNGYYRALGVDWKASRKELMRAYWLLDGQSSHHLTYVLHQLLNPSTRRAYDCMRLGEIFWDDLVTEAVNQKAKREAYLRSQSSGADITQNQVLSDWGYVTGNDLKLQEALDEDSEISKDEDRQRSWGYAYFLWKTLQTDTSLMMVWQQALVAALSDRGGNLNFSVGICGKLVVPYVLYDGKEGMIAFLSADYDPEARTIEELAPYAARHMLEM
jgi:hypothetical protein